MASFASLGCTEVFGWGGEIILKLLQLTKGLIHFPKKFIVMVEVRLP